MLPSADTIYALSSAAGKAGVAVVRVSGPRVPEIISALCKKNIPPRHAHFGAIYKDKNEVLDEALTLYFKAPASFTGEEVAEFHIHGSRAVLNALLVRLATFEKCRMAEAGEFTRRAMQNGKLDLAEAEGLADLINAETEAQSKQALRQMGGALSQLYESWRATLLRALAYVEADIDFPEEDLPPKIVKERMAVLRGLEQEIAVHLADHRRGERLREGFSVAILGAPNAGKSSLLNALAQREAAIVSARAGTTRDVVEAHLDLSGYPVIVADTAGLRDTQDEIEHEGIARALQRAATADLKIILFDACASPDEASLKLIDENSFVVVNKVDEGDKGLGIRDRLRTHLPHHQSLIPISTKTGAGISELLAVITQKLQSWAEGGGAAPPLTRARHRESLLRSIAHVRTALTLYGNAAPELIAEELRLATREIGRITGRVDVEDLLDVIFKDFCIGK